ncbi:MAG TPA: hypothetical protein VGK03_09230 [Geothrix sp.]|jgi:hypothetical protein
MRAVCLLAIPLVSIMAAGAQSATRVLKLIPAQAQAVVYCPDLRRLEAKWSKVVGHFGAGSTFLELKHQTGIDPSRLGSGPVARVSVRTPGTTETWAWLLPAKDPKAVLQGLHSTQKGEVWTWEAPGRSLKPRVKASGPTLLFGTAKGGYLIVADSGATLAAFQHPDRSLSAELAPYATWMEGHDLSVVATRAAIEEAAQAMSRSFKPAESKAGAKPAAASRTETRLHAKFDRWAEMARASVHHALAGLDLSEDGGVAFVAQALLTKGSPLSREWEALPSVAGHPMRGLAGLEFALALGGEWSSLFDFQSMLLEDLDRTGKVQPTTSARLQKVLESQNALTRSLAVVFSAPVPRGSLMSGLTSLVRVSDSQAYLAGMEELSKAQSAFFQDLGMPGAVSFTSNVLPGVPSCGVTTRFSGKNEDPASASSRMAMTRVFGGDAIQMSLGALDDHQVLAVMGSPELLKARMDEARKSPEGLAPSIVAVDPDLGKDHRFALYLDPRGMRNIAQAMVGLFGGPEGATLPAIPEVPAAGFTLSLDPTRMELRGSIRAETLQAAATLFKAIGALAPANRKGARPPEGGVGSRK